MHERNWETVGGYAGIVAVLSFVVPGFFGTGTSLKPSDPDRVYKTILVSHHAAVIRQDWFQALGAVLIVWLASGIHSFMRRHDEANASMANLVFALFVLAAGMLGVSAAIEGGMVYRVASETSPATVRLVYDMTAFLGSGVLALTTMLAAAVIAVAALTARAMSHVVGYVSAVTAAVSLAASLTVFTTKGFFSLEGTFGTLENIVTMVWLLALSVALIRSAKAVVPAMAPVVSPT